MDPLARYEPLVDDPAAFREACARPLPRIVRANTIKIARDRARQGLEAAGAAPRPIEWDERLLSVGTDRPGNTWPYVHGWIHGQEAVSALPTRVLDPQPGERVFDACAAPGSKATGIAAAMGDRGTVVANDASLGRLSALRSNADRLGVTALAVTNRDARSYDLDAFGFDTFDRALVDAPCSCEGTVRKNPDALDGWSEEGIRDRSRLQRGLLTRAIRLTRPGGVVVYSTCTFAPEENEAVVDHALDETDCRVLPFDPPIEAAPGVTAWGDRSYARAVERTRRFYPHLNDTGGFFCAKLAVTG